MASSLAISLLLRGLHFAVNAINWGVSIAYVAQSPIQFSSVSGVLAISTTATVHSFLVVTGPVLKLIPNMIVFSLEVILVGLWTLAFVLVEKTFVTFNSCSKFMSNEGFPNEPDKWCQMGRSLVAFTFFSWFIGSIILIYVVTFTIIPICKIIGFKYLVANNSNDFIVGAIFSKANIPLASTDPEERKEEEEEEKEEKEEVKELDDACSSREESTDEQDFADVKVPGTFETSSTESNYLIIRVGASSHQSS